MGAFKKLLWKLFGGPLYTPKGVRVIHSERLIVPLEHIDRKLEMMLERLKKGGFPLLHTDISSVTVHVVNCTERGVKGFKFKWRGKWVYGVHRDWGGTRPCRSYVCQDGKAVGHEAGHHFLGNRTLSAEEEQQVRDICKEVYG